MDLRLGHERLLKIFSIYFIKAVKIKRRRKRKED
jgi:hypothetical protein